ncbi:MAG: magnesium transporter [Anaerolineae bacterium]
MLAQVHSFLLQGIEDPTAADILEEMTDEQAAEVASALDPVQLAAILAEMETEEAADVLGDIPQERAEGALHAMDDAAEAEVRTLLAYPDDTAGGRMSPGFIALAGGVTAAAAIAKFRTLARGLRGAYYLYVTDEAGQLAGVVNLRELLTAAPEATLASIMRPDPFSVRALDDQEKAAHLMARYDLLALPVVDADHRIVGVIQHEDLVDVLLEEATEDMYRLAGIGAEERPRTPVSTSVRQRLPWLVLNLGAQLLLVYALLHFSASISRVAALAVLFPIVTGQGGNVGAQTMTVVIRAMALGELDAPSSWRLAAKELAVGAILGLAVGMLAGAIALAVGGSTLALQLAAAVWLAMILNLGAGALATPLFLERIGVDPALASSMLVTTVTDTMGVVFFMGIFVLLG